MRLKTLISILFVLMMAYGFLNLFWSYHPTDDGWTLGLSWRILHGEIPHRDFLYSRPPLTPIIHTIWFWFPERLTFPLARASFYLWHCVIVLVVFLFGAKRFCPNAGSCLVLASFAVLGFLWGVHNFPPMPWFTVDSVLLCSLGFLLVALRLEQTESKNWPLLWGGMVLGLAPWSKQNFAIVPLWVGFFLACQALMGHLRWKEILLFVVGVTTPTVFFVFFLKGNGALSNFVQQILVVSRVDTLTRSGIDVYLDLNRQLFFFALFLGALAGGMAPLWNRWAKIPSSVFFVLGTGVSGLFCCWTAGSLLFCTLAIVTALNNCT